MKTCLEMDYIFGKGEKGFFLGSRNTYHLLFSVFCKKMKAYCRTQRINVEDGYA